VFCITDCIIQLFLYRVAASDEVQKYVEYTQFISVATSQQRYWQYISLCLRFKHNLHNYYFQTSSIEHYSCNSPGICLSPPIDPLQCGWCSNNVCSTRPECLEKGFIDWYSHAPPPAIHSV